MADKHKSTKNEKNTPSYGTYPSRAYARIIIV
nr:MAG TPA: hypothetical protein [Caudoviricetes sp.]